MEPIRSSIFTTLQKTLTPGLFAQFASKGKWQMARHLQTLDLKIMAMLAGIGPPRLIVTMPPRHGKLQLISKYLPAWYLGTHPNHKVILASYGQEFASQWGREARGIFREFAPSSFGLQCGSPARVEHWGLQNQLGSMMTAGAGGPLTGRGADLLIIDDPIKNNLEANSPVYRQRLWEWWTTTASTRLEPNGKTILIQTRWHEDDLAGRLLAAMAAGGPAWQLLSLPAIDETGQPLWPERFTLRELLEKRDLLGSHAWAALYEQRPMPREGGLFRREWFLVVGAEELVVSSE